MADSQDIPCYQITGYPPADLGRTLADPRPWGLVGEGTGLSPGLGELTAPPGLPWALAPGPRPQAHLAKSRFRGPILRRVAWLGHLGWAVLAMTQ